MSATDHSTVDTAVDADADADAYADAERIRSLNLQFSREHYVPSVADFESGPFSPGALEKYDKRTETELKVRACVLENVQSLCCCSASKLGSGTTVCAWEHDIPTNASSPPTRTTAAGIVTHRHEYTKVVLVDQATQHAFAIATNSAASVRNPTLISQPTTGRRQMSRLRSTLVSRGRRRAGWRRRRRNTDHHPKRRDSIDRCWRDRDRD